MGRIRAAVGPRSPTRVYSPVHEARCPPPAAQADRAIEAVNTATETLAKALAMLERSQRSQIVRVAA